jgi:hypothetical protein
LIRRAGEDLTAITVGDAVSDEENRTSGRLALGIYASQHYDILQLPETETKTFEVLLMI